MTHTRQSAPKMAEAKTLVTRSKSPAPAHPTVAPAWERALSTTPLISVQLPLQTKLTVNAPSDAFEQEAEQVAERVMRMPEPRLQRATCACGGEAGPDGECAACKAKRLGLQRRATPAITPHVAPPIVHQTLQSPGQPLDSGTRSFMEPRFGYDFGNVRVHTEARASESAHAVQAKAYTVGHHIVFASGEYAPRTRHGQRLLAHELAHVVQQQDSGSFAQRQLEVSDPSAPGEREADHVAEQILNAQLGITPRLVISSVGQHLMRDFDSTMRICQRLLRSRTFHVDNSVVSVTLQASWVPAEEGSNPQCSTAPYYYITLNRVGVLLDSEMSTHPVPLGARTTRVWRGLAGGDYYLTIWTNNTNPNCCLEGDISVATPAGDAIGGAANTTLLTTACYDGDILYVSKGGRSFSCPALTGTVGEPTPPGVYCIRRQGEAQVAGGLKGRLLQDRPSWFLLEPQFPTTRYRMQLHPGTMSSGCITVMDRSCFDQIASILNIGGTVQATGYDGYPPGNDSGTENPAHAVDCVGMLTVTSTIGGCTR